MILETATYQPEHVSMNENEVSVKSLKFPKHLVQKPKLTLIYVPYEKNELAVHS